ncbi:hypothetical protein AB9P05_00720 [Roseivirga sp. BDSF3-8]|uniref:hypothetical protein n=1 Tax=Roseivirga sp. BDSF3-8 TaxID=3241598 RepID=UPI0035321856
MTSPETITGIIISLIAGLILLFFQALVQLIFKAYKRRKREASELKALINLGRIVYYFILCVIVYGFITRPIFSKEKLRDELAVINPGQILIYDMDLRKGFRDVIDLSFEVIDGGPVNTYLIPMDSIGAISKTIKHVPNFSIINSQSGKTSARVEPGFWSILIQPSDSSINFQTKIQIKTYVSRPRFFQKTSPSVILLRKI